MKKPSLFSYKAGRRWLCMLGLTVFLFAYFCLCISLINGDLVGAITDSPALAGASIILVLACIFLLCACFSPIIYLNAVKWMWPFLKNAFYEGICWLPFLNRLTPEYRQSQIYKQRQIKKLTRQQKKLKKDSPEWKELEKQKAPFLIALREQEENDAWLDQMEKDRELAEAANTKRRSSVSVSLTRLADLEDGYYYDDEYYTGQEKEPNFLQKLLAFVLGGFLSVLLQIAKGLGYLVLAIGLPLLSPLFIFLLLGLVAPALTGQTALMTVLIFVLLVVFAALFVAYPIFCLRICPKPQPKK